MQAGLARCTQGRTLSRFASQLIAAKRILCIRLAHYSQE